MRRDGTLTILKKASLFMECAESSCPRRTPNRTEGAPMMVRQPGTRTLESH